MAREVNVQSMYLSRAGCFFSSLLVESRPDLILYHRTLGHLTSRYVDSDVFAFGVQNRQQRRLRQAPGCSGQQFERGSSKRAAAERGGEARGANRRLANAGAAAGALQ
jgi:hypothetical protein